MTERFKPIKNGQGNDDERDMPVRRVQKYKRTLRPARPAVAEFIYHYRGKRNHQGLGNAFVFLDTTGSDVQRFLRPGCYHDFLRRRNMSTTLRHSQAAFSEPRYGGETREVGAIDVNIDQDLVA